MKKYTRRGLWPVVIAALTLTLAGQLVAQRLESGDHTHAEAHLDMAWRFRPKTFLEGRDRAPLSVLAEVLTVARGDDLISYVPNEPNGEARLPTQRITLNVLKVYRGTAAAGQRLTLFQSGGFTNDNPVPRFALDNPRYQQGERYVLLLEPAGQSGLFRIIAPEGRYHLVQGDIVTPIVDNAVTRDLRGKPLQHLEQLLGAR